MTDKEIVEDQDVELHEDENEIMDEAHDPKNAEAQSIAATDKAADATGTAPKRKGDQTKKDPMIKTKAGMIAAMVGSMQKMDKKAKKRLDIVRKTLQKLRLQLSGARKQDDEPGEVQRLETQIAELEQEAEKLKNS